MQDVRQRLLRASAAADRAPDEVRLLAVSKTFPATAIREAWAAGQRAFGESYVQEALPKIAALADLPIEWHFIGPLQGNKTRLVAEHFAWVHSVDRVRIAERLSAQRPDNLPKLEVCVQVNVGGEASKSGVPPDQALSLARQVAGLPRLRLRGFMTIPRPDAEPANQFRQLRRLLNKACDEGLPLDTLSMGMSHDLESAIMEGATIVRIGTAIFGRRD